jgi:GT2 family glycosyltransferase
MQPAAGAYPRVGIVVVAYNAESTLLETLDRIPTDFSRRVAEVIVCDDASHDGTFDLGRRWAMRGDTPDTHLLRHTKNLGYGGN